MSEESDTDHIIRGAQSFGHAIAEMRHRRALTQAELAERASVHRSYLAALEGGSTTEAIRKVLRILAALDLEVVVRSRQDAARA
jgi:HTH-type transcriptional regulator/antitoxin HipB